MEPLLKWLSVSIFSVTILFTVESVTNRGLWDSVLGGLLIWAITGSILLASLAYSSWRITMLAEQEEKAQPSILKPHASFWSQRRTSASIPMTTYQKVA